VPHSGHFPFAANRPFFIVTFCASFISLDFLHFTQYPFSAISYPPLMSPASGGVSSCRQFTFTLFRKLCTHLYYHRLIYVSINSYLQAWLVCSSSISPTISSIKSSNVAKPIVLLCSSTTTAI